MKEKQHTLKQELKASSNSNESVSGDINKLKKIFDKIQHNIKFSTKIVPLESLNQWEFDNKTGNFFHQSKRFFSLQGLRSRQGNFPILVQPEIGILGLLCSKINGVLQFLVQLKIEPGNPNGFQLSPTVQATRSNYSQVHGGKLPQFLEFFIPGRNVKTLKDSYQSEQGFRYYQKRNRNMIVYSEIPPNIEDNYLWMTLRQIKEFAKEPIILNSCLRSVISMLPLDLKEKDDEDNLFLDDQLVFSMLLDSHDISIDDSHLMNLNQLKDWKIYDGSFRSKEDDSFKIIGVEFNGFSREINSWTQPLLQENSKGEYGLLIGWIYGKPKILWKLRNEPGLIKGAELGPSWIIRGNQDESNSWAAYKSKVGQTLAEIDLAEEGGRFYKSVFNHKIVSIGEIDPKEIDADIIPLSIKQTERFISNYSLLTIEARSLWVLIKEEWLD